MKMLCTFIASLAAMSGVARADQVGFDWKDWTSSSSGGVLHFDNTSSAGTIQGTTSSLGWSAPTGTFGVPTVITSTQFTTEFNANGAATGFPIEFVFSPGYGWGTGGELLIGNIHNYYEYELSAWDFSGAPIDVNQWVTPAGLAAEYDSTAPGTLGYFSTSSTTRAALGNSSDFFVFDPSAQANSGQGGVFVLGGLLNVGRIEWTLLDSALAPNGQSSDFILFNVATPTATPEPSSIALLAAVVLAGLLVHRRQKSQALRPS